MQLFRERKLPFGFLILLSFLLVVIGMYIYRIPDQQKQQGEWVVHTYEVLNQLETLSNHLTDAETGQRGYLLTKQPVYLRTYFLAIQQIDGDVARFQQITQDNSRQQSQIPFLRKHIAAKLAELKATIHLRRSRNANAALNLVTSERGREQMQVIRQQIDQMKAEEQRLLRQRMTQWRSEAARARWMFLCGVTLVGLLLSMVYYRLLDVQRRATRDQRAESERLAKVVAIQRDVACAYQDLQAAMQMITERTQEITHADGGVVELLEGDEMIWRAVSGMATPHLDLRLKAATSLSGRCAREKAVLKCDDAEIDDRVDKAACRKIGVRSMVVVPLLHEGVAIGVLKVLSSRAAAFTRQDIATLELMAGVLSAALSNTERKRLTDTFERFFGLSADLLLIAGFDGYFQRLNPAWERVLGYTSEELMAVPWLDFVHPDDRESTLQAGANLAEGKDVLCFENRYRCRDGSYRWLYWNAIRFPEQQLIYAIGRDITERKAVEEELREAKHFAETVAGNSTAHIYVFDLNTMTSIYANHDVAKFLGYAPGQVKGTDGEFFDIIHPDDREYVQTHFSLFASLKDGEVIEFEQRVHGADGNYRCLWHRESVFKRNPDGSPSQILGTALDVTKHKRSEEALRISEERFRLIVEGVNDYAIFTLDTHGCVASWNAGAARCKGYSATEIIGKHFSVFYAKNDIAEAKPERELEIARSDGKFEEQAWRVRKDGSQFWANTTITPMWDAEGRLCGYTKITRDLTERKQVEADLEKQQFLASIQNEEKGKRAAELVIAKKELAFQNEEKDKRAAELVIANTELNKQEFLASIVTTQNEIAMAGPSLNTVMNLVAERTRLLTNADAAVVEIEEGGEMIYRAARGTLADSVGLHFKVEGNLPGMCFRTETPLRCDDTATDPRCDPDAYLRLNIRSMLVVPIYQDRQVIGVFQVAASTPQAFEDPHIHTLQLMAGLISTAVANVAAFEAQQVLVRDREATLASLRASEEVLQKQSQDLVRSNTDLEQFAYVASHDLQEPLRMIGSYLELLNLEYSERLDDEAREYIAYAVDGAVRMKCLINDLLAYSRVGTQGKPMQPTSAGSLLLEVLADLPLLIEETGAIITYDPLPTVSADRSQLRLVLQNLIGNAIKFRGAEVPRVHISATDVAGEWRFSVQDNGIGIKAKHAERIFVIFQRLHNKTKYTGTGIGLTTCKRVVERHGGRIWVESEPGNGSTFFFTLPHATALGLETQAAQETCLQ